MFLAAKDDNQAVRVCAEHLRQYNEALYQSNTIRMCDAFSFLNKYYKEEMKKKYNPDDEDTIQITDTERFLFKLFNGIITECNAWWSDKHVQIFHDEFSSLLQLNPCLWA